MITGKRLQYASIAGALCVAAALVSGCAAFDDSADARSGERDKPLVVTSFTILEDMAREVAGDRADVRSITKPGAEIHHYEPTPRDLANAHGADLIIANGMGLELWFEQFLDQLGDVRHIDASDGVTEIPITSGKYQGKANPHAWMSPEAAHVYVTNIRDGLIEIDPDGESEYNENTERYLEQIDAVDERLRSELDSLPAKQRTLTSCEGAFSYLTSDYGMQELYLWPINAESQGTPAQIASVVDRVRADRVPAVFCESTVNSDAQEQVATETGARFAGKLYVDSLSKADGPVPTYLALLQYDVDTIIEGLTS